MKRLSFSILFVSICAVLCTYAFEGQKSEWGGCDRYDFTLCDREAIVVVPQNPLEGNPWLWRPAFFDAFPQLDHALLKEGFHIAYFNTTDEWGRKEALDAGEQFYNKMVNEYGLMPRPVMEGLSRGGYYSLRWAQTHPQCVGLLLLDNPLVDIFALYQNPEWRQDFLYKYHLEEASRDMFRENVVYNLDILADNKIPVLLLSGAQDDIVPYEGHGKKVVDVYRRWNAPIKSIVRPNGAHHPHSLDNTEAAVGYIKSAVLNPDSLLVKRKIKVACIGNSITEGVGTTDASKYSYPSVLQQMLGEDYEVGNFGVSCATVLMKGTDAGRPFGYNTTAKYKEALEYNPDIVIIKLGGNDSKDYNWQYGDEFAGDYQDLIDAFKYLPSLPQIYLCLPVRPKVGDPTLIWGIDREVIRQQITPIIEKIAYDNRLPTIDLFDAYEGEENACYADNVHPTNRGVYLLALKIYKAIREEKTSAKL